MIMEKALKCLVASLDLERNIMIGEVFELKIDIELNVDGPLEPFD